MKEMSFDEQMKGKIQENPEVLPVTDIPDEIICRIRDYKFKADARGNDALFMTLLTADGMRIIQKYMPSSYAELNAEVTKAGGFDQLKAQWRIWRKTDLGQMKKPRLIPTTKTAYDEKKPKKT